MEYRRLGNSGLRISRIGMGCMSFGTRGFHQWTLEEGEAAPFFRQAVELGVTFWDTANGYGGGSSEEFVGRAVERFARREDIVLATKVHNTMHDGPGGSGLSRKAILSSWTPRYAGSAPTTSTCTSSTASTTTCRSRRPWKPCTTLSRPARSATSEPARWAWQFAKLQRAADLGGWTRLVSMQDQYNLLKREEEREMLPMCADLGVGAIPYSPLGKGRLARPWGQQTLRGDVDQVAKSFDADVDEPVVNAVQAVAAERGVPMAQIGIAWLLTKPVVTAPIVGATKPHHLADAVAALDITLTEEEIERLEVPYLPQPAYWW